MFLQISKLITKHFAIRFVSTLSTKAIPYLTPLDGHNIYAISIAAWEAFRLIKSLDSIKIDPDEITMSFLKNLRPELPQIVTKKL